jgi:hypothetical protein
MLRLLLLAAAPPPAPPTITPGLPPSPNFSGKSRKGRPARSGGRPFLGSPGVKPNQGRRRGGGLVPSKTDRLERTTYNGPARVEMAPEAVPLIAFQRQRRHSNLGTASGTNPANAPVLLVALSSTRPRDSLSAPGRRKQQRCEVCETLLPRMEAVAKRMRSRRWPGCERRGRGRRGGRPAAAVAERAIGAGDGREPMLALARLCPLTRVRGWRVGVGGGGA